MSRPPHQAGSSPHPTGNHHRSHSVEQRRPPTRDTVESFDFDGRISNHQDSPALYAGYEPLDHVYGNANAYNEYHRSDFDFDLSDANTNGRYASNPAVPFVHGNGLIHQRSVEYDPAAHDTGTRTREHWRRDIKSPFAPSTHSMPRSSVSVASGSPAPATTFMQSVPQQSIEQNALPGELEEGFETKYTPFQSLFSCSEAAKQHRHIATRFDRLPYFDPATDPSIADTELHRNVHVARIYTAMTRGDKARDNAGSIAMKRWVLGAAYAPELVESYAHKVFDALIAQVKYGFRGWVHNDYVADERKGDDIDKEIDCAGRLDNIILALEQEKTICEDVMNSACQIRMFVNAPRAYANRKHQNRVGNSKRGRTKDTPDPNPGPTKMRRTSARPNRPRSSTTSALSNSRGTPPQQLLRPPLPTLPPPAMPYYTQRIASSPGISSNVMPRSSPMSRPSILPPPRTSMGQHPNVIPPPHNSPTRNLHTPQSYMPHMMPTFQFQSAYMSPLQLSQTVYPAPNAPDDLRNAHLNDCLELWPISNDPPLGFYEQLQAHAGTPVVDPSLSPWNTSGDQGRSIEATAGSTEFEQDTGVNLADLEGDQFVEEHELDSKAAIT